MNRRKVVDLKTKAKELIMDSQVAKKVKEEVVSEITPVTDRVLAFKVRYKGISTLSGAVPEDVGALVEQPTADDTELEYMIVKAAIEKRIKEGRYEDAAEYLHEYQEKKKTLNRQYKCPTNGFEFDEQAGCIYIGAHCFVGAFRDAATSIFPEHFYQKKAGQTDKPSKTHLRKYVHCRPNHIFLYRDGKLIKEPDDHEIQHPSPAVRGFGGYRVVYTPYEFEVTYEIHIKGQFEALLSKPENVAMIINQAALHKVGSRRSGNYGSIEIVDVEKIDLPAGAVQAIRNSIVE